MDVYKPAFLILTKPWISDGRTDKVIHKLGFQFHVREEPIGFFSGIWVLWSNPSITINVLFQSWQLIHLDIIQNDFHGILSTVYGSSNPAIRKEL